MITSTFNWIGQNAAALGVLLAAGPVIWGIVQFILVRRAEEKKIRFQTYHSLIKQLVQREGAEQPKMLDRQIAVIFELRSFKHYFPVTLRILRGLRLSWKDYGPEEKRRRLMEELDLAIEYIEKKSK